MDAVDEVTYEFLTTLNRLRAMESAVPSPAQVHRDMIASVEAMRENAHELRMAETDVEHVIYALVAFADEIAQARPELHGYWRDRPLQLHFFQENRAGEGFFDRLEKIRGDRRRADALRIYYVCLTLGFQGKYAIREGQDALLTLVDSLRDQIERDIDIPDELSPMAEPPDEALAKTSERNVLLYVALGVFAVGIAVFIGLRVQLDHEVAGVSKSVDDLTGSK
jgi:type VI secretion system protein ImpK